MNTGCKNFDKLIKAQVKIINRHIDEHKWLNRIENKEEALIDFSEKFAWLMREVFCECCECCDDCEFYTKKIKKT